jgi:hypothetical protein
LQRIAAGVKGGMGRIHAAFKSVLAGPIIKVLFFDNNGRGQRNGNKRGDDGRRSSQRRRRTAFTGCSETQPYDAWRPQVFAPSFQSRTSVCTRDLHEAQMVTWFNFGRVLPLPPKACPPALISLPHILINISETSLPSLFPASPLPLITHASQHLRRVYPRGTRIQSSNCVRGQAGEGRLDCCILCEVR